jgi:photosystem II stability/assembly factor-like uncharacterized protein
MSIIDDTTGLSTTWTERAVVAYNYGALETLSDLVGEVESKLQRGTLSASTNPTLNSVKRWLIRAREDLMGVKSYTFARRFAYTTLTDGDYRIALPLDYNGGNVSIRDLENDRKLKIWPSDKYDLKYPDISEENSDEPIIACIKNLELWFAPPVSGTPIIEIEYDRSGQDTASQLGYDTKNSGFTAGLTLTGGASGATGIIIADSELGADATWVLVRDLSLEATSQICIRALESITDSIVLAGVSSGGQIWRSTDAGVTWMMAKNLYNESPPQTHVRTIGRITDSIVLAGTYNDAQIWRSTDAGVTWTLAKDLSLETPGQTYVNSIVRITDLICLASTSPNAQIWRSADAGATWTLVKDLSNETPSQTTSRCVCRVTDSICLAGTATDGQIWRSTDAGLTWAMVIDLYNHSEHEGWVLCFERITDLIVLAGTGNGAIIWRSTDAGATWAVARDFHDTNANLTEINSFIRVSDTTVYSGTYPEAELWRSIDAGVTWTQIIDVYDKTPPQTNLRAIANPTSGVIIFGTGNNQAQLWRTVTSGTLYLKHVTGTFQDSESISDSGSGTAVVDGTLTEGKMESFTCLPEIERFRCCDYAISEACESLEFWEKASWYKQKWMGGTEISRKADARRRWKEKGFRAISCLEEMSGRENQN